MVSSIEVTMAVSSMQCLFLHLIGQALMTESNIKPNFHRFSVLWDLVDELLWPILAATTSTLHSTITDENILRKCNTFSSQKHSNYI